MTPTNTEQYFYLQDSCKSNGRDNQTMGRRYEHTIMTSLDLEKYNLHVM